MAVISDFNLCDRKTANIIKKLELCLELKITPSQYEKENGKDMELLWRYLNIKNKKIKSKMEALNG